MKKLFSLLASLALAAGLLATTAATAVAHTPVQADPNYNADCDAAGATNEASRGFTTHRGSGSVVIKYQVGDRLTGAKADINNVQPLWPCYDANSHPSQSLVLVNMQGTNTYYNFVQAGIGKYHYANGIDNSPYCAAGEGFENDQTYFVYTPNYSNKAGMWDGHMCRATFVDFNNNGVPDVPVAGVNYEVSIEEYGVGVDNYWRVCFKRLSDGAVDCKNTTRTSSDGGLAGDQAVWWGFEAGNNHSALGVPANASKIILDQPRYEKAGAQGTWYYTENSVPNAAWGTNPSYYTYGTSQTGTGEYWWAYTNAH